VTGLAIPVGVGFVGDRKQQLGLVGPVRVVTGGTPPAHGRIPGVRGDKRLARAVVAGGAELPHRLLEKTARLAHMRVVTCGAIPGRLVTSRSLGPGHDISVAVAAEGRGGPVEERRRRPAVTVMADQTVPGADRAVDPVRIRGADGRHQVFMAATAQGFPLRTQQEIGPGGVGIVAGGALSRLHRRVEFPIPLRDGQIVTVAAQLGLLLDEAGLVPGSGRFMAGGTGVRTEGWMYVGLEQSRFLGPMGIVAGETVAVVHREELVGLAEIAVGDGMA